MSKRLIYLFDHPTRNTLVNERCVELPLAFRYIDFVNGDLIEIGAVTPYYCNYPHECIDPTDNRATKKEFAENLDYIGKNVLSISTIEHIGRGDYHLEKELDLAYSILQKIYQDSKSCMITWPIGYNEVLDKITKENISRFNHFFIIKRGDVKWEVIEDVSGFDHLYGKPFRNANSIIVIYKNVDFCEV